MEYFAHTRESGDKQSLSGHLRGTAELAAEYAGDALKNSACFAGLLHDLGKYQAAFQRRLAGGKELVDHSVCGAKEAETIFGNTALGDIFAYIVAGHHAGLPDRGNAGENETESTLAARLKKSCGDYSAWHTEIALPAQDTVTAELLHFLREDPSPSDYEFLIRYLYSCLTDADFLDTERFVLRRERMHFSAAWEDCLHRLNKKRLSFEAETALQKARAELQRQALSHADVPSPVYLLDMPTGSGKTLCSLAFALERARRTGKQRIIYVIPYTSIIDQTAQTFEALFPDLPILRHDSNVDFDELIQETLHGKTAQPDDEGIRVADILKKATENWDVPIIVTTNVQFFESIYSNRSGKLRKFHNMAESMLVFDEVHTLPISWFIPCMQAVEQLTAKYGSEALFLTATMPDFAALTAEYLGHALPVFDLIPDKSLYSVFEKCTFEDLGRADILPRLDGSRNTLVVCNQKCTAEELYRGYTRGRKYCLSTYLTPRDRSRIIGEIKQHLRAVKEGRGEAPVTVFSTSLIEAGVDLDFACVMRECAGLDSILQSAGRCNREGARAKEESKVCIFRSENASRGDLQIRANVAEGILREHGTHALADAQSIREYFDILYRAQRQSMKNFTASRARKRFSIDFKTIAKEFHLIDAASVGIAIPNKENAEAVAALKAGHGNLRKLRQDCASVSVYELKELLDAGVLSEWNGTYVLERPDLYSEETGLRVHDTTGNGMFY